MIRCFKCFSNILDKLKPNSFVFETNSLSRYNTTLLLFDICICICIGAIARGAVCYKFGAVMTKLLNCS